MTFRVGIPDEGLVQLYNRAMLTVYAPIMEPFGFVPLESMACGTPVVGIREAGVRETVRHAETGFLVDRDPEQFAAAVLALLDDDAYDEMLWGEQALGLCRERMVLGTISRGTGIASSTNCGEVA